ncbi:MAG: hypothetical protein J0I06_21410 [Planctomycetes bacterium]|nr:hypothetical protein [Planctomycetota bacterium]
MKTAQAKFAVLTAVALGGLAVLVPQAPATPADRPAPPAPVADTGETREAPQSIFAGTAIGVVLEANNNEVPRSGAEMMATLNKIGTFVQLPINFSAVALHSGLTNPRVVITHRPSMVGLGGRLPDGRVDPTDFAPNGPALTAISKGSLTKPNLEGRLYLAANMEKEGGKLKVKTFEFISWNSRQKRFDFGFIECDDVEPQIRVVDGVKCFSCHKNKGPILGQGPWSNSTHNDIMREAAAQALNVQVRALCLPTSIGQPRRLDTGLEQGIVRDLPGTAFDGMALLVPQGPAVDAAVRLGADSVRDREFFRLMTTAADARRGLITLLCAIVSPGPIEQTNHAARATLNNEFSHSFPSFAAKAMAVHKASSSTLIDFNPSGSQGKLVNIVTASGGGGWGSGPTLQANLKIVWTGDTKQVSEYAAKRAEGDTKQVSKHQPSNPKAFVPPPSGSVNQPSSLVSAQQLARVIGLTEGDRQFCADLLATAAQRIGKPKVTAATIARDVFSGPEFTAVVMATQLPDREDFKDRFVAGINVVLRENGAEQLSVERKDYASGPNVALVPGKEDVEAPIVATTACVRCHDVQKGAKAAFSPIPMLAFDPYDKDSREAWARSTDARKRMQVLARLLKRINEDRDMPPEDSAEHDAFRVKKPAEFDAMRDWLGAELKKAKGE